MDVVAVGKSGVGIRNDVNALAAGLAGSLKAADHRLILFGDSLTNGGYYSSAADPYGFPPASYFVPTAVNNFARSYGWSAWLGPISMQRIQVVKSFAKVTNGILCPGTSPVGVNLETQISQALSDPDYALATRCVIQIGTNDALQASGSVDAVLAELVVQIARLNKPIDLLPAPPCPQTTNAGDSMQIWMWLLKWRDALRGLAAASNGAINFIDSYASINNPTASPDNFASGNSYDNIHTNNAGAYRTALAYINYLYPFGVPAAKGLWPNNCHASTSGSGAKIDQGFANTCLGTASGGTGTGTIAGSFTVTNGAGASHSGSVATTAIPGGLGNMQTLAITSSAAGDSVQIEGANAAFSGGNFLATGDAAYFETLIRIRSGGIYPRNIMARMIANNVVGVTYDRQLFEPSAAQEVALPFSGDTVLLMRTPTFLRDGNQLNTIVTRLRFEFAAAGSCTVDFCNWQVRRIKAV